MAKLPDELKQRSVALVLPRLDEGVNVSRACREVGAELGVNSNTLRKLVAEHKRIHGDSAVP